MLSERDSLGVVSGLETVQLDLGVGDKETNQFKGKKEKRGLVGFIHLKIQGIKELQVQLDPGIQTLLFWNRDFSPSLYWHQSQSLSPFLVEEGMLLCQACHTSNTPHLPIVSAVSAVIPSDPH